MHRLPLSAVQIGSVITEPILANGNVIYPAGTLLTLDTKESLLKFDVKEVVVNSYLDNLLHGDSFVPDALNKSILTKLQSLNVEDVVAFSTVFVQNALQNMAGDLLFKLSDYDSDTYQHSVNVAYLACMVGVYYGMSTEELSDLTVGALLHDVGKFSTPLEILKKNGKLNDFEYDVIKRHPTDGVCLFAKQGRSNPIIESAILEHHENYDGSGYPFGKKGSEISVYGQIVHLCDVYDALCSVRSYKKAVSKDKARHKMYKLSGTMFNPELLNLFMKCVPNYVEGEVLNIHGNTGIVFTHGRDCDALISCGEYFLSVSEFYSMQKFSMAM